ncbi:hypothetical protein CICLE_v10019792mg [Citrus x clementina]|uniref:F-box/FBD/LRR-repeat protein n=2 Tax=Citrus TaxID=2706 RepID=A0ACB8MG20_CITSI|nr:hypothetical protein CICLE_v10019792mg [Citrus x clementina]KAH9784587.1 F-box/FBD/LRR-repeat protein [Citrus sinensis]
MVDCAKTPKIPRLTCGKGDGDRLSNLPEHIIYHIFSFMETVDVVRASTVSRRWRYLWLSVPYLNFDYHTIWSDPESRWSRRKINDKFKDFVNWVIFSQNGSVNIQRFRLCCWDYLASYDNDRTIYRWVSAMARRNVQVLDLAIASLYPFEFDLPHSLVTCDSLVELKLSLSFHVHRCFLKLPTAAGFIGLKSLDLQSVALDDNLFPEFISNLPLLENLCMLSCVFPELKVLDISSTNLKNLALESIVGNDNAGNDDAGNDDAGNYKLKIACPNLVSFNYIALAPWLPHFAFESLNSLQNAFIDLDDYNEDDMENERCHVLSTIFNDFREVKVLKLSEAILLEVLDPDPAHEEPAFFSTSFNNLKSLILSAGPGVCLMPSMLRLLNCSPNLEALAIYSPKVILTPKTIPFVRYRRFYPFFLKIISPIYVLKF